MKLRSAMWSLVAVSGVVFAAGCGDDGETNGGNTGGTGGQESGGGGGSNTGGSNTGGSNTGGMNTGGMNTGGMNTGGMNTGGMNTGGSNTGGMMGSGGAPPAKGCPDHPNVDVIDEDGGICGIEASDTDPMTEDLTLDAGHVWVLTGPLFVGDDEEKTVLTIEPGVTVFGEKRSLVVIQRGSQIMAEGTKDAPIVFTSSKEEGDRKIQDWGGLVLNGRAPINAADNADGSAPGEANTGRYGGDMEDDNSGVLKYVRVEFAGDLVDEENEVNGIAFQGVGNKTTVDYVQAHMTADDCIEFFGGTVNVKHVVCTGANDDNLDWTFGWSGKAQFVLAKQLDESGGLSDDPRGIEADNQEDNPTAEPISNPIVSNVTLISRDDASVEAMRLRRGTKGQIYNVVVKGWATCVNVTEDATGENVQDDSLALFNNVLDCDETIGADNLGADLIDPDRNVIEEDPMLDDWMPKADSPALGLGDGPDDSWFEDTDYAGAFDGENDWTEGWIETATE